PGFGRLTPKRVSRRKSQRKESRRAQVTAAGGYVRLSDGRLVTVKSDGEPAFAIERTRGIKHSPHHSRQSRPHLGRRNRLRKIAPQSHLREQMKRAEAISERSARWRKTAVRRNQSLLDGGISDGSSLCFSLQRVPRVRRFSDHIEHVQQQRMDHEAVVVVEVELGTIAIYAIAFVPGVHRA